MTKFRDRRASIEQLLRMSFRRHAPVKPPASSLGQGTPQDKLPPGVKPASTPTISTGTATLDALLSSSVGLPVSSAFLVEEDGTGNYSGVILRQYIAEGVVQGDRMWVGGVGEGWWRGVPALAKKEKSSCKSTGALEDKMKIAWRYGINEPKATTSNETAFSNFCHSFDISEQLPFPGNSQVLFSPQPGPLGEPYQPLLSSLAAFLEMTPKTTPIRIVLPDFLNPLIYSPESTNPAFLLKFIHTIVAFNNSRPFWTLVLSLSTSFYPRTNPVITWIEHLCSHVIQLCPLPRPPNSAVKQPQGLVKVHKGGLMMKEMAYRVGRTGMVLEEWSLPPLEEETPRVKQGFVIAKDSSGGNVGASLVSGVATKDLEF